MKGIREHYENVAVGGGRNRQLLNYRPKEAMLNGLKFLSKRQLRHMTYLFSVRVACTVG